jgi:hypothetical protein
MKKLSTDVIHSVSKPVGLAQDYARYLTALLRCYRLKRAVVRYSSQGRMQLMGAVYVLTAITSITSIPQSTAASYSIDHLKLYAHSRILDYKEFQCFNKIITKESRWNYLAKNGSHFGLGQMRSQHYRDLDPYRQIDATLKYVKTRYSTSCKAWAFHQKRNFY